MSTVTRVSSYGAKNPILASMSVRGIAKKAKTIKHSQGDKLKDVAITWSEFKSIVNEQILDNVKPMGRSLYSSGYNYDSDGCYHVDDSGNSFWSSSCNENCEDCKGTY